MRKFGKKIAIFFLAFSMVMTFHGHRAIASYRKEDWPAGMPTYAEELTDRATRGQRDSPPNTTPSLASSSSPYQDFPELPALMFLIMGGGFLAGIHYSKYKRENLKFPLWKAVLAPTCLILIGTALAGYLIFRTEKKRILLGETALILFLMYGCFVKVGVGVQNTLNETPL